METPKLGLRPPSDDRHLRRWSLTAATLPSSPTAVGIGINWYLGFSPGSLVMVDGWPHFPPPGRWGRVLGGHATTLKPLSLRDNLTWWTYYDQQRNDCVGYTAARMSSLHNGEKYRGDLIYDRALTIDEFPGTADAGTSLRAGMDVLRIYGPYDKRGQVDYEDGIVANRWATSIEDVAWCLDPISQGKRVLNAGYVTMLQSWGTSYPHYVRIPLEYLERLVFQEHGEATVVTDR